MGTAFYSVIGQGYINAVDKFETDQALVRRESKIEIKILQPESSSSDIPKLKLSLSESLTFFIVG